MGGKTAAARELPPPLQMLQVISGFWIARCVYVAAKLGIPDLLKEGAKTAEDLAGDGRARAVAFSSPAGARAGRNFFAG